MRVSLSTKEKDNQTKMNTEGDIYKGDLKDGLPHGFGKVNYNDGDCY